MKIIAGCSVNPSDLGELLIATELYEPGIAAALMADLMEFDKTLHKKGTAFIHFLIEKAKAKGEAFEQTFQVIDEITKGEAFEPRVCELAIIDLPEHVIRHSSGLEIIRSNEVSIHSIEKAPKPTVTYVLSQSWKIEPL